MKKLFIGMVLAVSLGACQSDKPTERQKENKAVVEFSKPDSVALEKIAMLHTASDGVFDDFLYQFIQDSTLQLDRISFPLPYRSDGSERHIDRTEWIFDSIYSQTYESTLIFDGKNVQENLRDSVVANVAVEVVDLKQERIKLYNFVRSGDYWVLNGIDEHDFDYDDNHDFFAFYSKFANDETFQQEHVHDPFYFKTFDADNFQEIAGWVSAEVWADYRTYLPADKLINAIYDHARPVTAYRTFVVGSASSGVYCTLVFKRTNDRWELVRLEN